MAFAMPMGLANPQRRPIPAALRPAPSFGGPACSFPQLAKRPITL